MYHYISAPPSTQDRIRYGLSVPPEMLEAQLNLLREHGFATITLRQLYEYLANGAPLPERPIVLTFDDGYIDNYTHAFPILQKYGMIGTFFVLTGRADAGDPAYLSWDMIQEMSNAGMDIQLHLRDHLDVRNRPYDWLVFQIIGGRQSIEGHTGKPVIFMAYPSGRYDTNVQHFLRETDFWGAVTTASGSRHSVLDALIWDRLRVSGQLRLSDFARLLGIEGVAQRAALRPTATSTQPPIEPTRASEPTQAPTNIHPATATPSRTQQPPSTPPDGTPSGATPARTPFSSPLQTPTLGPSPLMTPAP
jgi:peptidoglycan/xylan/chitin deacetylase (PgdA/CDA1 family)